MGFLFSVLKPEKEKFRQRKFPSEQKRQTQGQSISGPDRNPHGPVHPAYVVLLR